MEFKKGDIVKFKGSNTRIHYRVIDSTITLAHSKIDHCIAEHIRIEVVGDVPVKHLEHVMEGEKGIFATDHKLKLGNQNQ